MKEFTDTLFTQDSNVIMRNPKILDFNSTYFTVTSSGNDVTVTNAEKVQYLSTRIRRASTSFGVGTYYFPIHGRLDIALEFARSYLPACTLKDLIISGITSSGGGTMTITILKNGVATLLTKALTVSTSYAYDRNNTDSFSVISGDYVTIQMVCAGVGINVRECIVRLGMVL